jgi:hypothetical protein
MLFLPLLLAWLTPACPWPNSSLGVHPFLTFDSGLNDSAIVSAARVVSYVWGGHSPRVWASASPSTIVSAYIPYNRDPDASHTLAWWKARNPSWVLYECDRVTPVVVDPANTNIALDVSNPDVVAWQVATYAASFAAQGYSAVAADNFTPFNFFKACGVWADAATWRPLYNGTLVEDPAYEAAQLGWLASFRAALHGLAPPLLLVPNFSVGGLPAGSPTAAGVLAGVDGVLDERGFTGWGNGFISNSEWVNVRAWARALQAAGKAFFSVNELGTAAAPALTPAARNFIVASWAMLNEGASGVFMACVQCYGWWEPQPEYGLRVGAPLAPAAPGGGASGAVWARPFEDGLALVNPVGASPTTVTLPSGAAFADAQDNEYRGSVALPGGAGLLLRRLSRAAAAASAPAAPQKVASFTPYALAGAGNPWVGFVPYLNSASAAFPFSMVNEYFPWMDIQTGPHAFSFAAVDAALAAAEDRGAQLIFRVYADYPGQPYAVPPFLRPGLGTCTYTENGGGLQPDYGNATLVEAMVETVAALGARYDGDARLAFFQVGFLGHWGEWHSESCPFAPPAAQAALLRGVAAAWRSTRVLARYPDVTGGLPAAGLPIGWHDDSFFQDTIGPESWQFLARMKAANATSAWRAQPIGGEVRPELQRCIFAQDPTAACKGAGVAPQDVSACIDAAHASWQWNNAAFAPPGYSGGDYARALAAATRMGYSLAPLNASVGDDGRGGGTCAVAFAVTNLGVAPAYYPVMPRGHLESAGGARVTFSLSLPSGGSLALLQPGEVVWASAAGVPMAPGDAARAGISLSSPRALKAILPAVQGVNASEGIAWGALRAAGGGGSGNRGALPAAAVGGAVAGAVAAASAVALAAS